MKIAVVENSNGETCSIFEPGFIAVYEEDGGQWKLLSRDENEVCKASGIAAVRRALADTVKKLEGLKTLVASEISGVAFSIFEAAGFEIFTVQSTSNEILNAVKNEMDEVAKGTQINSKSADIQLYLQRGMNSGDYFLNLCVMLAENPQLTTKSILLPYLSEGEFKRLDVVCGHIPPWFDRELQSMGLQYETVNVLPDKKTVRIIHSKVTIEAVR
jgi:Fe-only nitrogenase accessory protein AnfO